RMMAELIELEAAFPELVKPDSPSQRVGGAPLDAFASHTHRVPMLSLGNAFSIEQLRQFDARVRRHLKLGPEEPLEYVGELKIDGLAVSLTYDRGQLTVGAPRGDGAAGEDVTQNLRTVRDLPLRLRQAAESTGGAVPTFVEVRGEVYLTESEF